MSNSVRTSITRFPFSASQWQELEHQALIFKYMISGIPIPPDLLFTIRRSLDSPISSKFLVHQTPQHIGWNSFQMGFGKKIDPEPGRCRRTDGKKWRCSKEAYPDSKYCERHMHRGRNRSRKPVEILSPTARIGVPVNSSTSITNNLRAAASAVPSDQPHFLSYPRFSASTRPPPRSFDLSSHNQDNTADFFLESNAHSRQPPRDYRNSSCYIGHGVKEENSDEHAYAFFSEGNNINSDSNDSCWKLAMCSSQMKHNIAYNYNNNNSSDGQKIHKNHHQQYYLNLADQREDYQSKKVMHHFLDEYQPKQDKDSQQDNKISSHMHDFFMTQKW